MRAGDGDSGPFRLPSSAASVSYQCPPCRSTRTRLTAPDAPIVSFAAATPLGLCCARGRPRGESEAVVNRQFNELWRRFPARRRSKRALVVAIPLVVTLLVIVGAWMLSRS